MVQFCLKKHSVSCSHWFHINSHRRPGNQYVLLAALQYIRWWFNRTDFPPILCIIHAHILISLTSRRLRFRLDDKALQMSFHRACFEESNLSNGFLISKISSCQSCEVLITRWMMNLSYLKPPHILDGPFNAWLTVHNYHKVMKIQFSLFSVVLCRAEQTH